jgi:hypothetical protein
MKIAIMQPYIFPYIGYFQLINAVDKFIIFDDVSYINKGWINRNNILLNNSTYMFTLPLKKSSQNKLINEIDISDDSNWKEKFLKTLQAAYSKAPNYSEVYNLADRILNSGLSKLSDFLRNSLSETLDYLGINTEIINSSSMYNNKELKGQERIIDICKQENANEYINPVGGMDLYNKERFKEDGINLSFLKTNDTRYEQFGGEFISNLSIIDVMMFNESTECRKLLDQYSLM